MRCFPFDFLQSGPYAMLPEANRPEAPDLIANSIGMTESFAYHTIEATGAILPEEKRGACGRYAADKLETSSPFPPTSASDSPPAQS